jgi:hypothetical protein
MTMFGVTEITLNVKFCTRPVDEISMREFAARITLSL